MVDGGSKDRTCEVARELGARVLVQSEPGMEEQEGVHSAPGRYIINMDADLSPDPDFARHMSDGRGGEGGSRGE